MSDYPTMNQMVVNRTPGLTTEAIIDKLLKVCNALSGSNLYPYQVRFATRIFRAILEREAEELTALWSRQCGKSEVVAAVGGSLMLIMPELAKQYPNDDRFQMVDGDSGAVHSYAGGFLIGVYAPKKKQAGIVFRRLKSFFNKDLAKALLAEIGIVYDTDNGETIEWSNGSRVMCSTASVNANIEGDTHHLIILDESQDIADQVVLKSIGPMLAASGGTMVKIGTANYVKSHYFASIQRNKRLEASGAMATHFEVNYLEAQESNKLYRQYITKEKRRLGETSDEFLMAYMVQFMLHRGMGITEDQFNDRGVVRGDYAFPRSHPSPNMSYAAGIDFGKVHDSTVVTLMEVDWTNPREIISGYSEEDGEFEIPIYAKHICGWLEMQGDDYTQQLAMIKEWLRPWNVERMALDYTGVGIGLGDHVLAAFPEVDIELITYTPQSKDVLARMGLADIHRKVVTWPSGPECRDTREWKHFKLQFLDLEKEYKNGLMNLHKPDARGAHDDYWDSYTLAVSAASTQPFDSIVEETAGGIYR